MRQRLLMGWAFEFVYGESCCTALNLSGSEKGVPHKVAVEGGRMQTLLKGSNKFYIVCKSSSLLTAFFCYSITFQLVSCLQKAVEVRTAHMRSKQTDDFTDYNLGRSYYTFATVERKPATRFSLSPGHGNCVGAVAAKPSHVPAALAAGGGKPGTETPALCLLREPQPFSGSCWR